jgi:hypothetical protein
MECRFVIIGLQKEADEQRTEMDYRFLEFWSAAINVRAKHSAASVQTFRLSNQFILMENRYLIVQDVCSSCLGRREQP